MASATVALHFGCKQQSKCDWKARCWFLCFPLIFYAMLIVKVALYRCCGSVQSPCLAFHHISPAVHFIRLLGFRNAASLLYMLHVRLTDSVLVGKFSLWRCKIIFFVCWKNVCLLCWQCNENFTIHNGYNDPYNMYKHKALCYRNRGKVFCVFFFEGFFKPAKSKEWAQAILVVSLLLSISKSIVSLSLYHTHTFNMQTIYIEAKSRRAFLYPLLLSADIGNLFAHSMVHINVSFVLSIMPSHIDSN